MLPSKYSPVESVEPISYTEPAPTGGAVMAGGKDRSATGNYEYDGNGNVVMSVNMVNIIGKTNSIESGPTRAWAPLTSSAKTESEIANARAESSAMKRDIPNCLLILKRVKYLKETV